jgi:hypothetical protein
MLAAVVAIGVLVPLALANSTTGWSTPVYVSANSSGEAADVPAVALSNGAGVGNLAATWLDTLAGAGITTTSLESTFDDSTTSGFSTPSSPGFADPMTALDTDDQQVAEDGQGDALGVWIENAADDGQNNGSTDGSVMSAYESEGTDDFGAATSIQDGASDVKNSEPHVAFDAGGDAVAVWAQLQGASEPGGTWAVEYAVAPAGSGGTFGPSQTLVSGLSADPQPDLTINQSGSAATAGDQATIVYVVPGSGLWVSQGEVASTLAAPTNAYNTGHTLAQPVVATADDGSSAIAWVDTSVNNGTVYEDLMTGLRSSFVRAPDYIRDESGGAQSDPQVAIVTGVADDDETAVAFYDGGTGDVVAALQFGASSASGCWQSCGVVPTTEPSTITQQPQLEIPSDGAVTLLWETSSAVEAMTSTAAPSNSGTPTFSAPAVQLSPAGATFPTCDAGSCAAIATDVSGDDLAAVWLQDDSNSNVQVAASCYYKATGSTGFDADTCSTAKTAQTISFPGPGGGTAGGSESLSATGGGSGNPVVFSIDPATSPSDACTVSGTNGATVNFAHAGSCVIDANQAGDADYTAAPQTAQTVAVSAAATAATATTTAPTTTTAAVHPPVVGKSTDIAKASGTVQVELPGTHTFVTVSASEQIPFGAVINATHGTVTTTIALPGGGTSTATFWAGEFTLSQSSSGALTATLVGGSYKGCPSSKKATSRTSRSRLAAAVAKASKPTKKASAPVRSLWSNAKGDYTTKGHDGAAAVLGTTWLTRDQCDGTYFYVKSTSNDPHGEIEVTVLHLHRHKVKLKRGHSLLAPAPGFS